MGIPSVLFGEFRNLPQKSKCVTWNPETCCSFVLLTCYNTINNCVIDYNNLNDVAPLKLRENRVISHRPHGNVYHRPHAALCLDRLLLWGKPLRTSILRPITSCSPSNQMRRICTRSCPNIFGTFRAMWRHSGGKGGGHSHWSTRVTITVTDNLLKQET